MNRSVCGARAALAGLLPAGAAGSASAESEWLAICSQCVSPTIFAKSGIGTANARAAADGAPKPLDYSCAWRALAATAGKVVRKGLVADQQGGPNGTAQEEEQQCPTYSIPRVRSVRPVFSGST